MSLGPYPDFNWSLSRHGTLEACLRRYYWNVYGFWGGWEEEAPESAQLAYRLKKLTNLDFALGTAVHRRAYELTELARDGREPPSSATLIDRTRTELGRIYRASREDFVRDPKAYPMLHSFYYVSGPEERVLERIREKLQVCIPHLRELDLWESIRRGTIQVAFASDPEKFLEPTVEFDGTGIYTNLDLILWSEEDGTYTVVDWKTGKPQVDDDRQIAVYGLFVREHFAVPECLGRIVYLLDGSSRTVALTSEVFEETEAWIEQGIAAMRRFVADPELNRPRSKEAFPMTDNRWECKGCNFFELCEDELRATGPLPWE